MSKFEDAINALMLGDKDAFKQNLSEHIELVTNQVLKEDVDESEDCISDVIGAATQFGGTCEYLDDGVFEANFDKKNAVLDFADWLDSDDRIYSYEVLTFEQTDGSTVETDVDVDDIEDDANYTFTVLVYLTGDEVLYDVEYEDDVSLNEVKRRIKVNSQGKKRIKMQCAKGFKWNGNACVKISGAELATSRIAKRKAVINKRSQGQALKIRTLRKTRKANRFRKAFGLREDLAVSTDNGVTNDTPCKRKDINESVDTK